MRDATPSEQKAATPSLGDLLGEVTRDLAALMRQEVAALANLVGWGWSGVIVGRHRGRAVRGRPEGIEERERSAADRGDAPRNPRNIEENEENR